MSGVYNEYIRNKFPNMTKTQRVMNRIVQVDNFQNMACCCANWAEFVDELAEWGVDHAAGVDFDDPDLNVPMLNAFIKAENGYVREVAFDADEFIDLASDALNVLKEVA